MKKEYQDYYDELEREKRERLIANRRIVEK